MDFSKNKFSGESGFSLPELSVVMMTLAIMAMFTIFSPFTARKYAPDNKAFLISDILREARQRSLTQRETMRVEFNETKNQVRLINEHKSDTADDDAVVKTLAINDGVMVGIHPGNVYLSAVPTTSYSIPEICYSKSDYPASLNDQTFTLRFLKTGEVVDKGNDNTGSGAVMTGATVYVYETPDGNAQSAIVRAITISGVSGANSILKCQADSQGICREWVK